MSKLPCCDGIGVTSSEAMGEKQDMQALNNKLAYYIEWVRKMKSSSSSSGFTASSYSEGMKQLEGELVKLKTMYESELQKLRTSLMDSNREKNRYAAEAGSWADAKSKLAVEISRSKGLEAQLAAFEKTIAEKQKEIAQLKITIKQFQQEAGIGDKYKAENETLRFKLSEETQYRKNLDVKLKQLLEKHQFQGQIEETQKLELHERVRVANEIIVQLETKMKKLNTMGDHLPAALQKLREGNLLEMRKFQQETNEALTRNMNAIKRQMGDSSSVQAAFIAEKRAMEMKMREYSAKYAEYQSKCASLVAENQALKKEVESGRASAQASIASLQKKLVELQNHLMCHSKEFANAREAQASLRTEINAYKALLDVESGRLSSRASSRPQTVNNGYTNFSKTTKHVFHTHSGSFNEQKNSEAFRAIKDMQSGRISVASLPSPRGSATPKGSTSRSRTEKIFYGSQPKPGWR